MSKTIRIDPEVAGLVDRRQRELYQAGAPRPTKSDAVCSLLDSAERDKNPAFQAEVKRWFGRGR